jgi:ribonucleoside-diphosphate reductase alpha chain
MLVIAFCFWLSMNIKLRDIEKEDYLDWQQSYSYVKLDWNQLSLFEKEDNTSGSRELACTAGVCEVVDLSAA